MGLLADGVSGGDCAWPGMAVSVVCDDGDELMIRVGEWSGINNAVSRLRRCWRLRCWGQVATSSTGGWSGAGRAEAACNGAAGGYGAREGKLLGKSDLRWGPAVDW
jgi:hypothetical protein